MTVAGMTKKLGVMQVMDVNNFSKYGWLLRVTSWVERFLFNLQSSKKGEERKTKTKQLQQKTHGSRLVKNDK